MNPAGPVVIGRMPSSQLRCDVTHRLSREPFEFLQEGACKRPCPASTGLSVLVAMPGSAGFQSAKRNPAGKVPALPGLAPASGA